MTTKAFGSLEPAAPEESLMTVMPYIQERPVLYLIRPTAEAFLIFRNAWDVCLRCCGKRDVLFEEFQSWVDKGYGDVGAQHAISWKAEEIGEEAALKWFFEKYHEYLAYKRAIPGT